MVTNDSFNDYEYDNDCNDDDDDDCDDDDFLTFDDEFEYYDRQRRLEEDANRYLRWEEDLTTEDWNNLMNDPEFREDYWKAYYA